MGVRVWCILPLVVQLLVNQKERGAGMPARNNAIAEITRFWLQARHGYLVNEAVSVKVRRGNSDIDLVAVSPDLCKGWSLPDGTTMLRAIVETKDEHDFDPRGHDFGKRLAADVAAMGDNRYIKTGQKAQFSMLRQEHYEKARELFGTAEFSRLFVVHAIDVQVRAQHCPALAKQKDIHWMTILEVVEDLQRWYKECSHSAALRNTLVGDLWHLLVGYCGLTLPSTEDV